MSTDPRLADPVLLALAALRAKRHQHEAPPQTIVLQVVYDAGDGEPPELGERYVYELPAKAARARSLTHDQACPAPASDAPTRSHLDALVPDLGGGRGCRPAPVDGAGA